LTPQGGSFAGDEGLEPCGRTERNMYGRKGIGEEELEIGKGNRRKE
jgi:hypothetical protein